MTTHRIVSLVICVCAAVGSAAAAEDDSLILRAGEVTKLFRADPDNYGNLFNMTFLAAVPDRQLTGIFTDYFKRLGSCTAARLTDRTSPVAGKFDLIFDKGFSVPATIAIDSEVPHLIGGLWIGTEVRFSATLDEVAKELGALPGAVSFEILQMDSPDRASLVTLNPDRTLAIGSAFKLYILAELIRSIEAGQRRWSDVVTLDSAANSLPSGELQNWPAGSPITLHSLAAMMISHSDNTAADQLLQSLGRQRVEQMLSVTGNKSPERSIPFLSTAELFKLKSDPTLAAKFLSADLSERRKILQSDIASLKLAPPASTKPAHIDSIEWFASAADLCRLMTWIRDHTEKGDAAAARGILSINPGLDISRSHFPFIAFKGGSEAGVLNLTYLVRSNSNIWYVLAVTWNNPAEGLEERKLFGPIQRAFQLLK